ncbi:modular serine protease-like [Musca autumnalis]|uniref:modular serine protease-like n=1 Tax=Musca autumnalis TaxID=221902 RepID=UPI003CF88250
MKQFYGISIQFFVVTLQVMVNAEIFADSSNQSTSSGNDSVPECSINSLFSWQCDNGQCIQMEELCDGVINCEDESDETVEHCIDKTCPDYAFKCAYGGCIPGNERCNGIRDCIDGSDEIRYLCDSSLNFFQELRGSCWLSSHMQCKTGECISRDSVCDGVADCKDASDETLEICSIFDCPDYSFRCGYGACVPGNARCNGIRDCLDGSDELPSHCGVISTTTSPTSAEAASGNKTTAAIYGTSRPSYITSSPTTHTPTPPISMSTSRPMYVTSRVSTYTQSSYIPSSTTTPSSISHHISQTSRIPIVPSTYGDVIATKFCTPNAVVRGVSTIASCSYNNTPVSCYHNVPIGTSAQVFCAAGYVRPRPNLLDSLTLYCNFDGEWNRPKFKCVPRCGVLSEDQKRNTIKPWDVTVFRRSNTPIFKPICSGVIVSPKIVISAGTCLLSGNGIYATDPAVYNVVEGYYNYVYREGDPQRVTVHNISAVRVATSPSTADNIAILVLANYFKFSDNVKPVCLPSIEHNPSLVSDKQLNVGRGITRDTSREYLEFIISRFEGSSYDHERLNTSIAYIRVEKFLPFIMKEIKRYNTIL